MKTSDEVREERLKLINEYNSKVRVVNERNMDYFWEFYRPVFKQLKVSVNALDWVLEQEATYP